MGIFFANAEHVRAVIEDAATADGAQAVVLDCQTVPFVDVTAARMLHQLAADLPHHGVRLLLAGETGQVRDMVVAVSDQAGPPEYRHAVQEAVHAARAGPPGTPAKEG